MTSIWSIGKCTSEISVDVDMAIKNAVEELKNDENTRIQRAMTLEGSITSQFGHDFWCPRKIFQEKIMRRPCCRCGKLSSIHCLSVGCGLHYYCNDNRCGTVSRTYLHSCCSYTEIERDGYTLLSLIDSTFEHTYKLLDMDFLVPTLFDEYIEYDRIRDSFGGKMEVRLGKMDLKKNPPTLTPAIMNIARNWICNRWRSVMATVRSSLNLHGNAFAFKRKIRIHIQGMDRLDSSAIECILCALRYAKDYPLRTVASRIYTPQHTFSRDIFTYHDVALLSIVIREFDALYLQLLRSIDPSNRTDVLLMRMWYRSFILSHQLDIMRYSNDVGRGFALADTAFPFKP